MSENTENRKSPGTPIDAKVAGLCGGRSGDTFLSTRPSLRLVIAELIASTTDKFLSLSKPVYLEGFGILLPIQEVDQVSSIVDDQILLRSETTQTVGFEKCFDLTPLDKKDFPGLVDLGDLAAKMFPLLPHPLRNEWTEKQLLKATRDLILHLRDDVVVTGSSSMLESIGTFYSLHNRQGSTSKDWYAGADIFLEASYKNLIHSQPDRMFDRPILERSWELFEAAFGAPLAVINVDLKSELQDLGYDTVAFEKETAEKHRSFPVAIFEVKDTNKQNSVTLLYCSDGLRNLGLRAGKANTENIVGTELLFHAEFPLDSFNPEELLPKWPTRPLSMAWILMNSRKSKTLPAGSGISCDTTLNSDSKALLSTILATSSTRVPSQQLSKEGPFSFINVVGIHDDESALASERGSEFLLTLLAHKNLHQVTKPSRPSILGRSGYLQEIGAVAA